MEIDNLLAVPRWNILEILANKPSSPVEISKILNTSVAYVSQQLKLLEAANLIGKEKTKSYEKGKGRILFSLKEEIVHVTALFKSSPIKKNLKLDTTQKIIIKLWLYDDIRLKIVEKYIQYIEDFITEIEAIFLDLSKSKPTLSVITKSKVIKSKSEIFLKNNNQISLFIIENNLANFNSNMIILHDPKFIWINEKMKGGKME